MYTNLYKQSFEKHLEIITHMAENHKLFHEIIIEAVTLTYLLVYSFVQIINVPVEGVHVKCSS